MPSHDTIYSLPSSKTGRGTLVNPIVGSLGDNLKVQQGEFLHSHAGGYWVRHQRAEIIDGVIVFAAG